MSTEEGKSIYDGILYTVDERLETFEGSHWPFEDGKCTPLKMAEAGFYYCGTTSNPDWVRCIVCHIDMDGWEETDNPWEEHKKNSNCPFIKKIRDPYQITYGEVVELEKEAVKLYIKQESKKLREETFKHWEELKEKILDSIDNLNDTIPEI